MPADMSGREYLPLFENLAVSLIIHDLKRKVNQVPVLCAVKEETGRGRVF